VLANRRASCFVAGDQGGTYNGNPLMVAVAKRVFDVVSRPAFLARVRAAGSYLERRLSGACARHGLALRGRGLLWALVLPRDTAERVVEACFDAGLLLNAPRPHLLRLMPSLRVSDEEIDEMAVILEQVLRDRL
jgi:acetylornithine/N-succinyldiaminopimelate aminotransferase